MTGVIKRVADTSSKADAEDGGDGSYMIWLGAVPRPEAKEGERKNPEEPGVITCYFTRGKKSDLMKLRAGQVITVMGRCRGNGPSLENCAL